MVLMCPKGWTVYKRPSPEVTTFTKKLPSFKDWIHDQRFTHGRLIGRFTWEFADGVLPVQGLCGQKINFVAGFGITKGSEHSINVGAIFNVPKLGEKGEVTGGYSYTWTTGEEKSSGLEIELEDKGWEYLIHPVVLKFTIEEVYRFSRYSKFHQGSLSRYGNHGSFIIGVGRKINGKLTHLYYEVHIFRDSFFVRGGILVCRRKCKLKPNRTRRANREK